MDRRLFLRRGSAAFTAAALAPSLQGLIACGTMRAHDGTSAPGAPPRPTRRATRGKAGYGPLAPAGPELALPAGFSYKMFGVEGSRMSDGNLTPGGHDGMACFGYPKGGPNRVRLVRNHELGGGTIRVPNDPPPFGDPARGYDPAAGGGTTTLEVEIHPDGSVELVRDFVSLNGTLTNCAGGPTPWRSWLTCEETTMGAGIGFTKEHGYIFEVPVDADDEVEPVPLKAMGRFVHEAVAVDPRSGIVYETEDEYDRQNPRVAIAGLYRFIPKVRGKLREGGKLQMLAVAGHDRYDTATGQRLGVTMPVRWVDIDDPDPAGAEKTRSAVSLEGRGKGAATFRRLEGCFYGDESVYFHATTGGDARMGQVWQYRPRRGGDQGAAEEGELALIYESPGREALANPDNITVSPSGGIVICEDTDRDVMLRGLTPWGEIFPFAKNIKNNREFAGAAFSPDGRTLFVNIQGVGRVDTGAFQGMTFAIWGPWESGAL